jgi:homoserine kinase
MVRLDPVPDVTPVLCVAPEPVRTHLARGLLPEHILHRDAAVNAGRSALLIAALTQPGTSREVLLAATWDRLHQDYRASAMPPTHELVGRLRDAGLPAVVSGAGPSVLAFLGPRDGRDYRHDLDRLDSIVAETGIAWHVSSLDVERQGARVLQTQSPPGC